MNENFYDFMNSTAGKIALGVGALAIIVLFAQMLRSNNAQLGIAPENPPLAVTMGDESLPTITAYFDPLCIRCKELHDDTLSQVKEEYVDTEKLAIELRPVSIVDEAATPLVEFAMCANDQGAFWQSTELLYRELYRKNDREHFENAMTFFDDYSTKKLAEELSIDEKKLGNCIDEDTYWDEVDRTNIHAFSNGVESTPAIFVPGEQSNFGYQTFAQLQPRIDAFLAKSE